MQSDFNFYLRSFLLSLELDIAFIVWVLTSFAVREPNIRRCFAYYKTGNERFCLHNPQPLVLIDFVTLRSAAFATVGESDVCA